MEYNQEVAFVNRNLELNYLNIYLNKRPSEILFIYGPKSSGKTTLLYKLTDQLKDKGEYEIKFLNLRTILICNYDDFLRTMFKTETLVETKEGTKRHYNLFGLFKLDAATEKSLKEKREDPFLVMKMELEELNENGIKPIIIIDELQALQDIYMNGQRQIIIELFNFFVSITKESHLAHVIISSSDGYFIEKVYEDSRLRKTSEFYKIDYLTKEDVYEWLNNLTRYSKIKDLVLTGRQIDEVWEFLGGSCWEIQSLLSGIMYSGFETAMAKCKKERESEVVNAVSFNSGKKHILSLFHNKEQLGGDEIIRKLTFQGDKIKALLGELVKQNILFFDPVEAVYSPQSKSVEFGLKRYFEKDN